MYSVRKRFIPFIFLIDIVGYILFFFTKLKRNPKKIKKVLFIRLEHIGDMVLATPTFETFKKNNPGCEVHVLCRSLTKPLIENNPNVDKIIVYDAPWFFIRNMDKKQNLSLLIKKLKKENYDLVFEMHGDIINNYLSYRLGGYKIGYACRGGGFFLNKMINYDEKLHVIKQNLRLIEEYSKIKLEKTKIYSDKLSPNKALEIMNKYKLTSKNFVIVNPLSGRKEKDLTEKEIQEIIDKNKKYKIIFTGSKDQREFSNKFLKRDKIINICGETDLLTLVELVRKSKKVIAPDTGIIHIAKAVNTDFEAIYKTTDKNVWGY